MYGIGQIPLILQGAATRETLTPDQLYRLESQGIPTTSATGQKAPVNVSSIFPMLAIGAVAAWFLAGGSRRRSLWLALLLLPSMLSAQQFQQELVVGSDTFTVYGYSETATTTTVTVDSVVKRKPPPPIVTIGRPYGPAALMDGTTSYAPFTASPNESANRPQWLLDKIAKARLTKLKITPQLPCGSHNISNLGNCLVLKNGVPTFSRQRFDSAMATYNTPAVRNALAQAVKDSVVLAVNLLDEPWVTGGGDGNTWGAVPLSRALTDSLCATAKAALGPTVPVGTSDQTKWQRTGVWKVCDVGLAQYSYRFGQLAAWRDSILAVSAQQGYQSMFSMNWINGGTQDKSGVWDCPGSHKGQREPNCQMTPAQIVTAVTALGGSGCGILMMWRYDANRMALPGYGTAFQESANIQKQRAVTICTVRG